MSTIFQKKGKEMLTKSKALENQKSFESLCKIQIFLKWNLSDALKVILKSGDGNMYFKTISLMPLSQYL